MSDNRKNLDAETAVPDEIAKVHALFSACTLMGERRALEQQRLSTLHARLLEMDEAGRAREPMPAEVVRAQLAKLEKAGHHCSNAMAAALRQALEAERGTP